MEEIIKFVASFFGNYPIFGSILFIIGGMRVVMKPLFALLHEYVIYTPNEADNAILAKIEESPVMKGVLWVLDYFGSIKVVK